MTAEQKIAIIRLEHSSSDEGDIGKVEQLRRIGGKLRGFRAPGVPRNGEYVPQRDKAIELARKVGASYLEVDQDLVRKIGVSQWLQRETGRMFSDVIVIPKKKK